MLHAEEALAHLHCTRAVAGATGLGLGPGFGTGSLAGFTGIPTRYAYLGVLALCGFLQSDLHGVTEITAAKHLAATATRSPTLLAEHVAKNVTKGFSKAAITFRSTRTATVWVYPRVPVLVICCTLLRVRQHFISLFGFLELFFRNFGRVSLVAVGMVLHRKLAIGLLNFFFRGVTGNAQSFVIVSFGHDFSVTR